MVKNRFSIKKQKSMCVSFIRKCYSSIHQIEIIFQNSIGKSFIEQKRWYRSIYHKTSPLALNRWKLMDYQLKNIHSSGSTKKYSSWDRKIVYLVEKLIFPCILHRMFLLSILPEILNHFYQNTQVGECYKHCKFHVAQWNFM